MPDVPIALRQHVAERAGYRCEYCLLPQAVALYQHEPDHVVPRQHGGETAAWTEHFTLEAGIIRPLTPEARVTVKILRLNDEDRIAERKSLLAAGSHGVAPTGDSQVEAD